MSDAPKEEEELSDQGRKRPVEDEEAPASSVFADQDENDSEEEELDDEDLDLIAENTGVRRSQNSFKRLKRISREAAATGTSLDRLFEDEQRQQEDSDGDEDGEIDESRPSKIPRRFEAPSDDEVFSEDDLNDFIVHDEADDDERPRRVVTKKSSRPNYGVAQELGISNDTWNQVYDLFGDGGDYAYAMDDPDEEMNETTPREQTKLEDIYEPAEVMEKMFTDRDNEIRVKDVPERFQLRDFVQRVPDREEIIKEAQWIACQIRRRTSARDSYPEDHPLVTTIAKILQFMRVELMEVPFIVHHRQDYFNQTLVRADIWAIHDLDERWNHIISRKLALQGWSSFAPEFNEIFVHVADEDGVKDMSDYLQLHYRKEMEESKRSSLDAAKDTTKSLKRPLKRDMYALAKECGLGKFAKHFGITPQQFGENFSENYKQNQVEDAKIEPAEMGKSFICPEFPTEFSVLSATRSMIAQEIASNLLVRATLRDTVRSAALVSVNPTERGRLEIDESHEYYPFKYIREKPIDRFVDHQYILLDKAEKDGLLTIDFQFRIQNLKKMYQSLYFSDNTDIIAEKWNEQRGKILEMAFQKLLIPVTKRWVQDLLLNGAIDCVIEYCRADLVERVKRGSYRKKIEEDEEIDTPRVFAISSGQGDMNSATFGVLLDSMGSVVDFIKLNSINGKDPEAKANDVSILTEFFRKYEPANFVAIGGCSLAARYLTEEIRRAVENAYDFEDRPPIGFVADDIARVYQNSKRSTVDFPAYPPQLKYCVSLGRSVQEPLFEYASLFNTDQDILSIPFHPLQDQVPVDRLYRALERVMIDAVNDNGFDVNRALASSIAESPLQFVSGLGVRKAQALLAKIRAKSGVLETRADLVREIHMGKVVFINCASFIHINRAYLGRNREAPEILDTTRIHPEDYDLARKVASDALEVEHHPDYLPSKPVEDVMNELDKLDELVLEDFANMLFERDGVQKRLTLDLICEEFRHPYKDHRADFEMATVSQVFTMLTGENDRTLRPGMLVSGRVTKIKDRFVMVNLDSGIEGIVGMKNLSDRSVRSPAEVVQPDQVLKCKVIEVYKEKFLVELDARDTAKDTSRRLDDYFDRAAEAADNNEVLGMAERKSAFVYRPIQHPLFRNVDAKTAEEYLNRCPVGEHLFRPSSRGTDKLILSWKVAEKLIQHVQIDEFRKDNEFALGKELRIGSKIFSDLDEIAAAYVEPMVRFVRDLVKYPKFVQGSRAQLYEHVQREMMANPTRIPYIIGYTAEPGKFMLVYQMGASDSVRHEHITVNNKGYVFRGEELDDIVKMLNYFKSNKNNQQRKQPPQPQQQFVYPPNNFPLQQMNMHQQPMAHRYVQQPPPFIPAMANGGYGMYPPQPAYPVAYGQPPPMPRQNNLPPLPPHNRNAPPQNF